MTKVEVKIIHDDWCPVITPILTLDLSEKAFKNSPVIEIEEDLYNEFWNIEKRLKEIEEELTNKVNQLALTQWTE